MATYRLGVLAGDGIGPEVVDATLAVLISAADRVSGVGFELIRLPVGLEAIRTHGTPLPDATVTALENLDCWILGPHDSVAYPSDERSRLNPSGALRKRFDLFANIRPARAYAGQSCVSPKMDLVIVRENTEGFYADRNMAVGSGEFMPTPDVALMVGVFTRSAAERIARVAFDLARQRRQRVSIIHKANVLKLTTGLFRDVCRSVAAEFPDVLVDDYHIDAAAALLVRRGEAFDVIVTENMFGDILSDLTGELAGSLGLAGSINMGKERAMAQAVHGAAPDIAGKGIANPIGMIRSTSLLLNWLATRHYDLDLTHVSRTIDEAVAAVLADGSIRTPDLGGTASTRELTKEIVSAIR